MTEEFAPHPAIDLMNQDNVFLALEELGIAHMQHCWILANAPEHEDAAAVAEQASEFLEDLTSLFVGEAGPDRVVTNGWAGLKMGGHLRRTMPTVLAARLPEAFAGQALESVPDAVIIRTALEAYLSSLEKVSTEDAAHAARGAKLPAKDYVDFMVAWSGVFSGKADALKLDPRFAL